MGYEPRLRASLKRAARDRLDLYYLGTDFLTTAQLREPALAKGRGGAVRGVRVAMALGGEDGIF